MGIDTTAYNIVLVLHIVSVVVGFGSVILNGVYGAQAKKRQGPGGLAIAEANLFVSKLAEKVIFTVPVWGIILVLLSDGVWEFDQTWVALALVLYAVLVSFATLVQEKNAERMTALARELVNAGPSPAGASGPPPQVAKMEALEKKLGMGGAFLSALILTIVCLMIFKPGV